jgi:hypothetical protein
VLSNRTAKPAASPTPDTVRTEEAGRTPQSKVREEETTGNSSGPAESGPKRISNLPSLSSVKPDAAFVTTLGNTNYNLFGPFQP